MHMMTRVSLFVAVLASVFSFSLAQDIGFDYACAVLTGGTCAECLAEVGCSYCTDGTCAVFNDTSACPVGESFLDECSVTFVQQVQLLDSGVGFTVSFNGSTDIGGFPNGPADELFDSTTSALLGAGSTYQWQGSSTLQVIFGPLSTAREGSSVTFLAGAIGTADGSSDLVDLGPHTIAPAANLSLPIAVMQAPQIIGTCTTLVADGRGSSGRALTYAWAVSSTAPTVLSTLPVFVVDPASLADDTTHVIQLTVTDLFGGTAVSEVNVTKSAQALPDVQIAGPSFVAADPSKARTIRAFVSLPSCLAGTDLQFAWALFNGGSAIPLNNIDLTSPNLVLPPYTLPPQSDVYTAVLTVSQTDGTSVEAEVDLGVPLEIIVSVLDGGSSRSHPISSDLVLDASGSYHPFDDPANPAIAVDSFDWECTFNVEGSFSLIPCFVAELAASSGNPTVTIPAASLQAGTYLISVGAGATGFAESFPVSQDIFVVSGTPPIVSIAPLASGTPAINRKLVIEGSVTLAPGSDPLNGLPMWELRRGTFASGDSLADAATTPLTSERLVIAADELLPDTDYSLRLSASNGATGFAEISFVSNALPTGGSCAIEPSTGFVHNTTFYAVCTGWRDVAQTDAGASLTYNVAQVRETSDGEQIESLVFKSAKAGSSLPLTLRPGTNQLVALIYDSQGDATRVQMTAEGQRVTFTDNGAKATFLESLLTTATTQLNDNQDGELAMQVLQSISAALNDNSDTAVGVNETAALRLSLVTAFVSGRSALGTESAGASILQAETLIGITGAGGDSLVALDSETNAGVIAVFTDMTADLVAIAGNDGLDSDPVPIFLTVLATVYQSTVSESTNASSAEELGSLTTQLGLVQLAQLSSGEDQLVTRSPVMVLAAIKLPATQFDDQPLTVCNNATDDDCDSSTQVDFNGAFSDLGLTGDVSATVSILTLMPFPIIATDTVDSSVVNINVFSGGSSTAEDVSGLAEPILIAFVLAPLRANTQRNCRYWDEEEDEWKTDGCTTVDDGCQCTHLTNFAVFSEDSEPQPPAPPGGLLTLVIVLGASALVVLVGLAACAVRGCGKGKGRADPNSGIQEVPSLVFFNPEALPGQQWVQATKNK